MSQFTEDAPETLEDWNAILSNGCCCEMPECPVPNQECESISGDTQIAFVIRETVAPLDYIFWRKTRTDYADGGYTQSEAPATHWTNLGGDAIEPVDVVNTDGDPKTGATTTTRSLQILPTDSRDAGIAAMEAALDWDTMDKGDDCSSSAIFVDMPTGFPAYTGYVDFVRFRWVIPDTFAGSYFKITWDVAFFPTVGDATAVSTDNTWEWTGPGDPEDADSWKSGWYNIPLPSEPGENRVVNVRFECYHGASFGMLPQVTGEAVEFPP